MARNDDDRGALADAALTLLAREGARAWDPAAVDAAAAAAAGSTAAAYPTRADLALAVRDRIGERLGAAPPAPPRAADAAPLTPLAARMRGVLFALLGQPDVALALLELRLASARDVDIARVMEPWLRGALAGDVDAAGGDADAAGIAAMHYAIDGILLDRLTTPLEPDASVDALFDACAARLLAASVP